MKAAILIGAVIVAVAAGIIATRFLWPIAFEDWEAFRNNEARTAEQRSNSALKDPARVRGLHISKVSATMPRATCVDAAGGPIPDCGVPVFRASPIVSEGKLYIGSTNGYLYAFDANTLQLLWQFPRASGLGMPPPQHVHSCAINPLMIPSSFGIAASATIWSVRGQKAVIFAAPDFNTGEGHVFAVNADTGVQLWRSPVIARIGPAADVHEKTGYSSPIVANNRVYIGINDHCDDPIQKGRVVALNVNTGAVVAGFQYCSVGSCGDNARGGGVWSSVAVSEGDLFVTTGNTNLTPWNPAGAGAEPNPNFGLSLLRINGTTGAVRWKFQPVPFLLDQDPDWAATPTVMSTTCGNFVLGTQKDGWTYAVRVATAGMAADVLWGFPWRSTIAFKPGDGTFHGDTQYKRPGAAWGNVFVTTAAGPLASTQWIRDGYRRLYALDVCAPNRQNRIRWIAEIPGVAADCATPPPFITKPGVFPGEGLRDCLGPPTVTGGVFFVGTTAGNLVALGDPSLPGVNWTARCSDPRFDLLQCLFLNLPAIVSPEILANVRLDGTKILTEPVLVKGKVYVATDGGRIHMLEP